MSGSEARTRPGGPMAPGKRRGRFEGTRKDVAQTTPGIMQAALDRSERDLQSLGGSGATEFVEVEQFRRLAGSLGERSQRLAHPLGQFLALDPPDGGLLRGYGLGVSLIQRQGQFAPMPQNPDGLGADNPAKPEGKGLGIAQLPERLQGRHEGLLHGVLGQVGVMEYRVGVNSRAFLKPTDQPLDRFAIAIPALFDKGSQHEKRESLPNGALPSAI